jgi:hypothetical protein
MLCTRILSLALLLTACGQTEEIAVENVEEHVDTEEEVKEVNQK